MDGRARVKRESIVAIIIAFLATASLFFTIAISGGSSGKGIIKEGKGPSIWEKLFASDEKIDASILERADNKQSYTIKKDGKTVIEVEFMHGDSDNSYRYDISTDYYGIAKGSYIYKPDEDVMELYNYNRTSDGIVESGSIAQYGELVSKLEEIHPINYIRSNMNFEKVTAMKFFGVFKMFIVKNDEGKKTDVITLVGKSLNKYIRYISDNEVLEMNL